LKLFAPFQAFVPLRRAMLPESLLSLMTALVAGSLMALTMLFPLGVPPPPVALVRVEPSAKCRRPRRST
jgi:hypothetical protein